MNSNRQMRHDRPFRRVRHSAGKPVRHVLLLVAIAIAIGMGGCAAMVQMASPADDQMAAFDMFDMASSVDDLFPTDP